MEISKIHSDKVLEILKSEIKGYKSVISEMSLSGFSFSIIFPLSEDNSREFIKGARRYKYRFCKRVENLYPDLSFHTFSGGALLLVGSPIDIKIIAFAFGYAIEYGKLLVSL
ncbi:hypothetical protein [Borrelia miyamotoi]|uniref:hypothetical protein n=1 Tax=Borrelia miyamotoi TaxID=47466 RepID=UPI001FD80455|nr:hypothetical protein [Borrelia miyamotoi]WAZ92483.1 hypothetical protein O5402_03625 [Borrelia miyamotoi]